jgi:Cu2+-exporting ATPase/Cu+-exporting ATPase
MHCASCAALVTKKLSKYEGIGSADVNLATEKAKVEFTGDAIPDEALNEMLEKYGFSLVAEDAAAAPACGVPAIDRKAIAEARRKEKELELLEQFSKLRIALPAALLFFAAMLWEISASTGLLPPYPLDMATISSIGLIASTWILFRYGKPFLNAIPMFMQTGAASMDTLIGIGTSVAWGYSTFVVLFPGLRDAIGLPHDIWFDATIVVIGFVLLGKYLEARSRLRTGEAIEKLVGLQAKTAIVRRGGQDMQIPLDQVIPGDLVVVKPGAKIPVDGTIAEGGSSIDESMVTGEPIPVDRGPGDPVIGGTINRQGAFAFTASRVGEETVLARIIAMVEEAQGSKAPIQDLADRIAAVFVPAVLVLAALTFIFWLAVGTPILGFQQALAYGIMGMVGILVIACPCALGLATPTAVIVGIGKGAVHGILIRNAQSLETLATVDTVVFDKTGTITAGKPSVTDIVPLGEDGGDRLLQLAASLESRSEHPLAQAIVDAARNAGAAIPEPGGFEALEGAGVRGTVDGKQVMVRKPGAGDDSIDMIASLQREGKTAVVVEEEGLAIGLIALSDTIKPEAPAAVAALKARGLRVVMLTGDNRAAAEFMAGQAGIDEVMAEVLPHQKDDRIRALQQEGRKVAMAGDGINDAPALARADVGIAMSTGTDVAIESAGITVLGGDIRKIAQSFTLARATMRVIRQNLFWAFIYNLIGIPLAAGALFPFFGVFLNPVFSGIAMAGSSVTVVANSLRLKTTKL